MITCNNIGTRLDVRTVLINFIFNVSQISWLKIQPPSPLGSGRCFLDLFREKSLSLSLSFSLSLFYGINILYVVHLTIFQIHRPDYCMHIVHRICMLLPNFVSDVKKAFQIISLLASNIGNLIIRYCVEFCHLLITHIVLCFKKESLH